MPDGSNKTFFFLYEIVVFVISIYLPMYVSDGTSLYIIVDVYPLVYNIHWCLDDPYY